MATPDVLKSADTEPEAAHLRNVLRRIVSILDSDLISIEASLDQIRGAATTALDRPSTNGAVIDSLTRLNGDLQSEVERLRERIRTVKRDAVATHERLRSEIDSLRDRLED